MNLAVLINNLYQLRKLSTTGKLSSFTAVRGIGYENLLYSRLNNLCSEEDISVSNINSLILGDVLKIEKAVWLEYSALASCPLILASTSQT